MAWVFPAGGPGLPLLVPVGPGVRAVGPRERWPWVGSEAPRPQRGAQRRWRPGHLHHWGQRGPLLYSRKHRDHWQRLRLPCARCHRKIDYDGPQYFPDGRQNLRYLVVGHIVGRAEALAPAGRRATASRAVLSDVSREVAKIELPAIRLHDLRHT
jgi:hypothetical protein